MCVLIIAIFIPEYILLLLPHNVTNVTSHGGLSIVQREFRCSCRCVYYSSRPSVTGEISVAVKKERRKKKGKICATFLRGRSVGCFTCNNGTMQEFACTWNFVLKFLRHVSISSLVRRNYVIWAQLHCHVYYKLLQLRALWNFCHWKPEISGFTIAWKKLCCISHTYAHAHIHIDPTIWFYQTFWKDERCAATFNGSALLKFTKTFN